MNRYVFSSFFLFAFILISGCTQIEQVKQDVQNFETPFITEGTNPLESPTTLCINLCNQQKEGGSDFTKGSCLSDSISPNWVCDIAHDPRSAVDNIPENQCAAFINGTAKHFVEVDTNCNLIRTH